MKAIPDRNRRGTIANSHPLLEQPVTAVLTTVLSGGRLQSTPVWFASEGQDLLARAVHCDAIHR